MTKLRYRFFSFLQFWIPRFHWCSMPKFRQIYPVVLEKKFILLFLLFLVTAAILDFQPDPILQFWDPGVRSCSMWNLRTMGPVVLQKKMFEYLFLGVDGQIPWRRTTHWYDNSSLWPFGPGDIRIWQFLHEFVTFCYFVVLIYLQMFSYLEQCFTNHFKIKDRYVMFYLDNIISAGEQ